jgi:hypothetical protein
LEPANGYAPYGFVITQLNLEGQLSNNPADKTG